MFYEYKAYVTTGHRVVMHVVAPVLMVGFLNFISILTGVDFTIYIAASIGTIIVSGDYFGIGPICRKDSAVCTIIRCSYGGKKFVKDMLIQDTIIRGIIYVVAALATEATALFIGNHSLIVPIAFWASLLISTLLLNVTRHMESLQGSMFMGILNAGILTFGLLGLNKLVDISGFSIASFAILIIFTLLAVFACIISINYQKKKSEMSYHD